ncbi:Probable RNA-dependent RNA polymerase 5 [Linum grandiflorum]
MKSQSSHCSLCIAYRTLFPVRPPVIHHIRQTPYRAGDSENQNCTSQKKSGKILLPPKVDTCLYSSSSSLIQTTARAIIALSIHSPPLFLNSPLLPCHRQPRFRSPSPPNSMANLYSFPEYPNLPPTVEALVNKIRYQQVMNGPGPRPLLQPSTREKLARFGEAQSTALLRQIESQSFDSSFDEIICELIDQRMSAAPGPSYCSPPVTQYFCDSSPPSASPSSSYYSSPAVLPSSPSSSSPSPLKRCCTSQLPPPPPPQKNSSPTPTTVKLLMSTKYVAVTQSLAPRKLEDDLHEHLATNGESVSVMGDPRVLEFRKDHMTTNGGPTQMEDLWKLEFRKAFLILNYLGREKLEHHMTVGQIRQLGDLTMRKFEEDVWNSVGQRCLGDNKLRLKNLDWNPKKPHVYHCIVDHNHVDYRLNITFRGPFVNNMRNFLQTTVGDDHVLLVKFGPHQDGDNRIECADSRCKDKHRSILEEGIRVGPYRYHFFGFGVLTSHHDEHDTDGKEARDNRGKLLIHTDGTGFISEDLARLCPDVSQGRCLDSDIGQIHEVNPDFRLRQPPLLMQLRLFYNGSAVKGTLLVNKKLPHNTIVVRDSMVKVKPYDDPCNKATANSLEIVNTSRRPKPAVLSRNLIMLLSYGGIPGDFFMDLLYKALEDARAVLFKRRKAARGNFLAKASHISGLDSKKSFIGRAASFHHEKEMILSGIPFEESYLKFRLPAMMSDDKKRLKWGKLPLPDSYYLMGTADPSGVLKNGEVCIISDNGQVSGKVLVYRNPGLHFGDIHILDAVYVKEIEDYVGNAKFGIFFPTQGKRSLADEMAGGDYDGDMFFVSRNQELLDNFKQSKPWESCSLPSNEQSKKIKKIPKDMSDIELETELFKNFWNTRFNSSPTMGMAADSWQVTVDKLLSPETAENSKVALEEKISRLIDVYYDALDAPKTGDKVAFPLDLMVGRYPHYMEKKAGKTKKDMPAYHSTSILGAIYDEVQKIERMDEMPITEIVKLECFAERAPEPLLKMWRKHYNQYKGEMSRCCEDEATKNAGAELVNQRYKVLLYGPTGDFHTSEKRKEELFQEARAIYQVVYDYAEELRRYANGNIAEQRKAITKCGFVWKIAGTALCALYISSIGEKQMMCSESAYKEVFG